MAATLSCLMGFLSFFVLGDLNSPVSMNQHADQRSLTYRIWTQCLEGNGDIMRECGSICKQWVFSYVHNLASLVYMLWPDRYGPQRCLKTVASIVLCCSGAPQCLGSQ